MSSSSSFTQWLKGNEPRILAFGIIAPTLIAFDQDAWASKLDYHKRKSSTAIESFRRTRSENYELFKDLPAETFERKGNHNERGPVSLHDLLKWMAEHAEKHARQIQTVRQHYKASKAK